MKSLKLAAVVLGHIAFAGVTYATWAMGQKFAPEILMSDAVLPVLLMGVAGIWVWYCFWSRDLLLRSDTNSSGSNE